MLTLVMALAVYEACEELYRESDQELRFGIKWPNDIVVSAQGGPYRKICGILTEMRLEEMEIRDIVSGIGLNVNQTDWRSDAPNPVSLKQITGKEYDIDALMTTLMNKIHEVQTMRQEDIWEYYRRHLYRREAEWLFAEREVNLTPSRILTKQPKEAFKASIADITKQGELVLRTAQGEKKYHFKEILFVV